MGGGELEPETNAVKCKNEERITKPRWRDCYSFLRDCVYCGVHSIGLLCGHFCQKKEVQAAAIPSVGSGGQTQTPYYDTVHVHVVLQPHEPDLELKENVAYDPSR